MARIILADDHPILRRGLREIIEEIDPTYRIVAEAGDGEAALRQAKIVEPDILIADLAMPCVDGLALLERIREIDLGIAVVILSMYADDVYLDRAFALGARGYVLKDDASEDMARCLKAIELGELYISPRIGRPLPLPPQLDDEAERRIARLSPVQREVLRHLAQHLTSREIATLMGLSFRTVQNHRAHMAEALGLEGRNALLAFAVRNRGLLEP